MKNYRLLLGYAAQRRKGWALISLVTVLSVAFGLLGPLPMKILVDNALGGQPLPGPLGDLASILPDLARPEVLIAAVALAGLLIFAVNGALDVVLTFAWIRVGQRMVYDLAGDLFARVQRRSLLFHARNPVGDSMARVTGDSWVVYTVVDTILFTPAYALLTLIGMLAIMAALHVEMMLLSLVIAPLMTVSALFFGRPTKAVATRQREVASGLHAHLQRSLTGMPIVQAFTQEEREHHVFRQWTRAAIRATQRGTLVEGFSGLSSGLITTLGTGVILLVGSLNVLRGTMSVGTLLVFLAYLSVLQEQISVLTGIYTKLKGADASVERVMAILDTEPEVVDAPRALDLRRVRGALRMERVSFGYEAERAVLHDIDLDVRPGETIAIVGPTGAGKSTLVSLVPRFFDPWSGEVSIDGFELRKVSLASLRRQVAIVLQEPFLFPLSIAENISYGRPEASREEIKAAARAANAHTFVERLSAGYDTIIGERGATLSGGERQRISIARALLKDAPVLILDEPTSALDAETEHLLIEALERLMAGRTTLIIAHRLSTIRRADRIVVLREGRIVEQGSHAELLYADGFYAHLHRLQTGTTGQPSGRVVQPTAVTGLVPA